MHIIEAVILLVFLVLLSNIINHFIPDIPVSLFQILLGLGLTLLTKMTIPLETDWFLLLFIAPLLFNDGRRFPKQELWKLRGPILANAILLVFLTTVIGGFILHLIVPKMPLSVSFALIAILSPTDPVAVQSISKRVNLPENVLHAVSGESLINDASGLIAFKYAIAATVTGIFSIRSAIGDFIYITLIGLISGAIIIISFKILEDWLYRQGINDVIFNTVLQIITPFIIYLIAEDVFHASGVIAVVTAGIIVQIYGKTPVSNQPELILVREKTWDIIIYTLNGLVFVILGIELPVATTELIKSDDFNTLYAVLLSFIVWLILFIVRVLWIYFYQVFNKTNGKSNFKIALLTGLSGVRGAVTMAGVLTVPLVISSNRPFPMRSLMLFVAALVIIISLVIAVAVLPLISKNKGPILTRASASDDQATLDEIPNQVDQAKLISEDQARIYIMQSAVKALEKNQNDSNRRETYDLIFNYQFLIRNLEFKLGDRAKINKILSDEIALRRVALSGEHLALEDLVAKKQISMNSYLITNETLHRQEKRLMSMGESNFKVSHGFKFWLRRIKDRVTLIYFKNKQLNDEEIQKDFPTIQKATANGAIRALSTYLNRNDINKDKFNNQSVYHLIVHYRNQIELAKLPYGKNNRNNEILNNLKLIALAAERNGIQKLVQKGKIDGLMSAKLRQYVNYSETVLNTEDENI
ncbi:cation:proton antiporter [Lentilactobacillus laojiaonis]|uniref:cation:proton antiporter n=1 Tax=Lentilactobacillus laojiaonis TaxID=2883998 RepID=UPI001D09BF4C|nr:sodium:proton antiporter [Lentilactobacillus laojiaonis]UDM31800.1 sodium:proton antiporter [Lentilactobacillus laojiaonis]